MSLVISQGRCLSERFEQPCHACLIYDEEGVRTLVSVLPCTRAHAEFLTGRAWWMLAAHSGEPVPVPDCPGALLSAGRGPCPAVDAVASAALSSNSVSRTARLVGAKARTGPTPQHRAGGTRSSSLVTSTAWAQMRMPTLARSLARWPTSLARSRRSLAPAVLPTRPRQELRVLPAAGLTLARSPAVLPFVEAKSRLCSRLRCPTDTGLRRQPRGTPCTA